MTDRTHIVSNLLETKIAIAENKNQNPISVTLEVLKEILALLKEQEAVEPEEYFVGQDKYKFYRCPVCKIAWYYKGNYCLGCGRSVKWK